MTQAFLRLEPQKKTRIIHAALKEFAQKGYQQASTNRIVEKAGIGKGMLFYYFGSKEKLFFYLVEFALAYVEQEYLETFDDSEPDFIERHKRMVQAKMEAIDKNPYIFSFLGTLYLNAEVELPEEMARRFHHVTELGQRKRLSNIDMSLFRDDVDPELVFKLINWCMDGYERQLTAHLRGQNLTSIDYSPYVDEFYDYLEVLKRIFYQPERPSHGHG